MFGRSQPKPELTEKYLSDMRVRHREDELKKDPSSIPGMTQAELDDVINTGTIPTSLLNEIL